MSLIFSGSVSQPEPASSRRAKKARRDGDQSAGQFGFGVAGVRRSSRSDCTIRVAGECS